MTDATAGNGQSTPAPKKVREAEVVEMSDGRKVEFVGKAKFLKEGLVGGRPADEVSPEELEAATPQDLAIRLDFRHGVTRTYPVNPKLANRKLLHGMLQKYGDQLAGGVKKPDGTDSDDLDDWVYEVDALHDQVQRGEWRKTRVGGGGGGISILLQALMEFTGRTAQEVRDHIKDWTPQQKQSLRNDPEIKPIVDKIEREKAAKTNVDTASLKAGLRGLAA